MHLRESALVAFTLLMQASVGILLTVAAVHAAAGRSPSTSRPAFELPLLVAVVAAVAALCASLLHLGHPLQAWLAVANVRASWLSREIVLALLFVVTLVFAARSAAAGGPAGSAATWLAVFAGVATVYAMSRLYMVPAQPVWNRLVTPLGFFSTTMLLGVAVVLAFGNHAAYPLADATVGRAMIVAALVLAGTQIALLLALLAALPSEPAAALTMASRAFGTRAALLSLVCALGAIGILARVLLAGAPAARWALTPAAASTLLALVFASNIFSRLLFYAASVELGPR